MALPVFVLQAREITDDSGPLSVQADSTLNSDNIALRDTTWKFGTLVTFTLAQSAYDNWSAGGENASSINGRGNVSLRYQKGKLLWLNTLDLAYGYSNIGAQGFRKNDDNFEFNSTGGYKASKNWYYSGLVNVKSQFSKGIDYRDTSLISNFLAPLYVNMALGMNYTQGNYLSVFLTPLNAKLTFVNDTSLGYRYSLKSGKKLKKEFGLLSKVVYQHDITKNLMMLSKLEVFYDYLHRHNDALDRAKIPYISWEVLLSVKVFKALSVNLNTRLVYDDNYRRKLGDSTFEDPRIQFKEVFGIGMSYKF